MAQFVLVIAAAATATSYVNKYVHVMCYICMILMKFTIHIAFGNYGNVESRFIESFCLSE